jgi:hypothetical protein
MITSSRRKALSACLLLLAPLLSVGLASEAATVDAADSVRVKVDASKVLVERDVSLIGANLEDLNYQIYGGLYSQLLHGECFEEHVDPSSLLGLTGRNRLAVWVIMDAQNRPVLTCNTGRLFQGLYDPNGLTLAARHRNRRTKASQILRKAEICRRRSKSVHSPLSVELSCRRNYPAIYAAG